MKTACILIPQPVLTGSHKKIFLNSSGQNPSLCTTKTMYWSIADIHEISICGCLCKMDSAILGGLSALAAMTQERGMHCEAKRFLNYEVRYAVWATRKANSTSIKNMQHFNICKSCVRNPYMNFIKLMFNILAVNLILLISLPRSLNQKRPFGPNMIFFCLLNWMGVLKWVQGANSCWVASCILASKNLESLTGKSDFLLKKLVT